MGESRPSLVPSLYFPEGCMKAYMGKQTGVLYVIVLGWQNPYCVSVLVNACNNLIDAIDPNSVLIEYNYKGLLYTEKHNWNTIITRV